MSRTEVEALLVCQGVGRADFRLPEEDRISYDEALEITQRSHRYLAKLVEAGRLTRDGGERGRAHKTFLSRREVEVLALHEYQRGRTGTYWMTMTEVAELAGIARANVHKARQNGRLDAHRTGLGDWLVRRTDAYRFLFDRQTTSTSATGRDWQPPPPGSRVRG